MDMISRDILFLLFVLVICSTIALLFGSITVERWLMVQVLVLTYVAPSPMGDKKD